MLQHLDLFSGIGGFSLAAQMVGGIETRQFVEIDPYCQKVLAKNFPGIPIHDDIRTYSAKPGDFDLITGGFPCQDISCANPNGRGLEGERSGLFFELMRIVRECRPRYLVLENVAEMLRKQRGRIMGTVLWELSQGGYDAEWQTISAASVGAPHLRERVFIVATNCHRIRRNNGGNSEREYTNLLAQEWKASQDQQQRSRWQCVASQICEANANANQPEKSFWRQQQHEEGESNGANADTGRQRWDQGLCVKGALELQQTETHHRLSSPRSGRSNPWATESSVLRVAHGIPDRTHRIKGLGNSVVPQVAAIALQRVLQLHSQEVA